MKPYTNWLTISLELLHFPIFLFDGLKVNSECKEHDIIYFVLCSQYQPVERTVSPEGNRKKTSPVL